MKLLTTSSFRITEEGYESGFTYVEGIAHACRKAGNCVLFFSEEDEDVHYDIVKQAMRKHGCRPGNTFMHSLIIVPEIPREKLVAYTRHLMSCLEVRKRGKLDWWGLLDDRQDSQTLHILVMGHDHDGDHVLISKEDKDSLIRYANDWLKVQKAGERWAVTEV